MSLPLLGEDRRLQVMAEGTSLEIDWSHPLARGLGFFALPGHPNNSDLVNGGLARPIGSASIVPTAVGLAIRNTGATTGYYWTRQPGAMFTAVRQATLLCLARLTTLFSYGAVTNIYASDLWNIPESCFGLRRNSTTSAGQGLYVTDTGGSANAVSANGFLSTADGWTQYGVTRDDATAIFWKNGQQHSTGTYSANTNMNWSLGGRKVTALTRSETSPGEGNTGEMAWLAMWTRALSATEVLALYRDPLAFIRVR